MDIIFLTQTYPSAPEDTAGPFIRELARALVRGGDRVRVLTPHARGLARRRDDDGVEVEAFRYAPVALELFGHGRSLAADERVRGTAMLAAPLYALGAWRAVRRAVRDSLEERGGQGDGGTGVERNPGAGVGRAAAAGSARGGGVGWGAAAGVARGGATVVQAHWVVPNGPLVRGVASGDGGACFGIGIHGSDVFLAERRVARPFVRRTLAACDFVTGCSPELVDRVCAIGFPSDAARVIPYGVDAATYRPDPARRAIWRERLGVPPDAPLVLGLGRMATKKGFQVLVPQLAALIAAVPEVHVVLAGAGDLLPGLRAAAAPLGARVHFPGAVLRDTLPDLFRAADAFVLPAMHDPSGNVDGLPNVVLEAMASGLPVVTTPVSGIPLAVRDGVEGVLVPEGDGAALREALVALLRDPARGRALGAAARERAVAELSWETVAGRYRAAYAEGIARRAAGEKPAARHTGRGGGERRG